MAVVLTVSKTLGGSAVSDTLAGGAGTNTGIDLGQVVNGQYTPITLQSANTGALDLYVSHNAVTDPITGLSTYVQAYGTGTGYAYGGAGASAAADLTTLLNYGNASNSTAANNSDGLSGGLQIDMDYAVNTTNQFAASRVGTGQLRIYGASGGATGVGSSLANAIIMRSSAMAATSGGADAAPTGAVGGKVGKANDTVFGDHAHFKMRFYLPSNAVNGGLLQFEYVFSYAYTS